MADPQSHDRSSIAGGRTSRSKLVLARIAVSATSPSRTRHLWLLPRAGVDSFLQVGFPDPGGAPRTRPTFSLTCACQKAGVRNGSHLKTDPRGFTGSHPTTTPESGW